jgi:hypothetical protein
LSGAMQEAIAAKPDWGRAVSRGVRAAES